MPEYLSKLLAWDFAVDGHKVRPVKIAEIALAAKIQFDANAERSVDEFLRTIFEQPVPPVEEWDIVVKLAIIRDLIEYFQERLKKNAETFELPIAGAKRPGETTGSACGGSSPQSAGATQR